MDIAIEFQVPFTVSQKDDYYVFGTTMEEGNNVVVKLSKEIYEKSFNEYCLRLAHYHESINSFAGVGNIWFYDLIDANEITKLYDFSSMNDNVEIVDVEEIPMITYRIFEYTSNSSFCVDVEHG